MAEQPPTHTSNAPGNRVSLAAAEQSHLSRAHSNCQPSPVLLPCPGSQQAPRQDHFVLSYFISVKTKSPLFFFSPSPNNDCSYVKTKCNIWEIKTQNALDFERQNLEARRESNLKRIHCL